MNSTRSVFGLGKIAAQIVVLGCGVGGCAVARDSGEMTAPTDRRERSYEAVSLLGRELSAVADGELRVRLESDLAIARDALAEDPNNPDLLIWVGRRLGYLWRMREAIAVFSDGIERYPADARFYRHRGHRYISLRRFPDAITDLEHAAELIRGKPDAIEPDGMPNARGIPLTTLGFNVWYHLALARYLSGDYAGALRDFRETMRFAGEYDDNLVAVTDWMYMALRKLGRDEEARQLLEPITAEMEIIENHAYHRRLLMYQGALMPAELHDDNDADELTLATLGYGVGQWHIFEGRRERGLALFGGVVAGPYWPAFGFVASEVELARGSR